MESSRRGVLGLGAGLAGGALLAPASAQAQPSAEAYDQVMVTEAQYGDPVAEPENVTFDAIKVQAIGGSRAEFRPRVPDFSQRLLDTAASYVGKGRQNAQGEIADLLELFGLKFTMNGKPVPFCAAGASSMAAIVYARAKGDTVNALSWKSVLSPMLPDIDHHHFFPSPSVMDMYYVARGKHRWVDKAETPKPGWLVVYDWKKNGGADHVGIVERSTPSVLSTIEFNTGTTNFTNGGQIARKQRRRDATVKGFINTSLKTRI